MIQIVLRCHREGCDNDWSVPVLSHLYYNGLPFKEYIPKGWRIRTPKDGGLALAYCHLHADQ